MPPFAADSFELPIPSAYLDAFTKVWGNLAQPGTWFSAAERIKLAEISRLAEPLPLGGRRQHPHEFASEWEVVADTVERIATDPGALTRGWSEAVIARIGVGRYVELAAVVAQGLPIDVFCRLLGRPLEALPEPLVGEPSRQVPGSVGDAGAWVPMTTPFSGANVARAFSYVPADNLMRLQLVRALYSGDRFNDLIWTDSFLSRPQVELVAARTSALNECFY